MSKTNILETCPFCGGQISHNSDCMANEMYDGFDASAIVSFYKCMRCGRDIEITDPNIEEKETDYAEYWNSR